MTKAELRTNYLAKRKGFSETDYQKSNSLICDLFFTNIQLSSVKGLHCFIPILNKREVDTWQIIDRIKKEFPHIRLSIPKINDQKGAIENFYFEGPDQLKENKWGIKEPATGIETNAKDIDVVLVPLLAFDNNGNRVGYGKGYYDKFLSTCRQDCKKVGLSLFPPIGNIAVDSFDIKLDCCITPEKIYSFT